MQATIVIKALEDGVSVITTNGEGDEPRRSVRLDKGEVLVLAAPNSEDGYNIRGRAEVYTPDHIVIAESGLVIGGSTEPSV